MVRDILRLRSRKREAIIQVLARTEGPSALLVPHVIPLLASEPVADYAVFALRKVAEERVGELTDALLDPNQDFACPPPAGAGVLGRRLPARRRRARPGARRRPVRRPVPGGAVAGGDRRQESARPPRCRARLRRRARVRWRSSRPVWESRRLLDGFVSGSPLDEFVRDRAGQSLAHVFTLLVAGAAERTAADRVPKPAQRRQAAARNRARIPRRRAARRHPPATLAVSRLPAARAPRARPRRHHCEPAPFEPVDHPQGHCRRRGKPAVAGFGRG